MSTAVAFSTAGRVIRIGSTKNGAFALFNRYLSLVRAESDELLDQVYRLRFQVYCVEREFENAAEHPDGRERDRDDCRSRHFLAADRASGRAVGTVRLILPRPGEDLPVLNMISRTSRRALDLPLATTAEVSRFAITKVFRSQLEARWSSADGPLARSSGGVKSTLPLVTYGLIRAVWLMSLSGNITHIVALMEPALLRLLRRLGVEFRSIGEPVQHHGLRQPGWAAMGQLLNRVRDRRRELWEFAPATAAFGAGF
jgi:N-acyl amino acid synthase of PEP-CTERM/exosortase system